MSGTAAPDPLIVMERREILAHTFKGAVGHDVDMDLMDQLLGYLDAADRAAGVIRVRVDDATVARVVVAMKERVGTAEERARAVLEALRTP